MATMTLACNGGTTLSYHSPNADLSENESVGTSSFFCSEYPDKDSAENWRERHGNPGSSIYWIDASGGLLSFEGNNSLHYKDIQKVTLSIDLERSFYSAYGSGGENAYLRPIASGIMLVVYVAPYSSTESMSNINKNNYKASGEVGLFSIYDVTSQVPIHTQNARVSVDITGRHKSWFKGSGSKYIVCAGLATRKESGTSNDQNNIYNASEYYEKDSNSETVLYSLTRTIKKATAAISVVYEDVSQPAPTPLYPTRVTVNEGDSLSFSWQFNSATAAGQKSATIQYKKTTEDNWTTITSLGEKTNYTINERLPQGAYAWRIAVTNIIDETSNYSDIQYFDIIGQPASPVINEPANRALTEFTWQATGQEAFELMLYSANGDLIDHVTEATTVTSYKPQMFLRGNYNLKVRIKNNTDLWSDFAQYGFTISGAAPNKGSLVVIPLETSVKLEWTTPQDANAVIIRRDKNTEVILTETIGKNTHEDKTIKGGVVYEYLLRTWTNGYIDTPAKQITCDFSGAIISNENNEIHLKVSDEIFIPHSGENERAHALDDFVGRDNPLLELGEAKRSTISKRFFVTLEELERFLKITKDLKVYYRDNHNNAFMAAVTRKNYTNFQNIGYILQFELTRLSEEEVDFNV